ncbi:serum amyloid A-5 protein-like [Lytechinus pictus]|uniref:serum amyloid A-5 protein-like n=1 Tax=Lytechinus pictus TaxID=7653 RepID=UPI00240D96A3|nr:serum amyloid A-5 protein-like [Lytechinus pictus]XP_054765946.1 serum amyloid A-5 protein-like [Lytechinus pictus]
MNASTMVVAFLMLGLLVAPSRAWPDWWDRTREAFQGAWDMYSAYSDMREANWRNSDKYFHARGNYDAAQRGPGGAWAAGVISNARESYQSGLSGQGPEDTAADQAANHWGRNGGDPNVYRPAGLPEQY